MMLMYMYQIFSSLQSQLHFFVHFFFTFMEYFFCGHPISRQAKEGKREKSVTKKKKFSLIALEGKKHKQIDMERNKWKSAVLPIFRG